MFRPFNFVSTSKLKVPGFGMTVNTDSDSDKVRFGRFIIASLWDHIGDIGISERDYAGNRLKIP